MKFSKIAILFLSSMALAACGEKDSYDPAHDYFSYANTDAFVTRHIVLDLDVDFETRKLRGSATLYLKVLDTDVREIILDTRDLTVGDVVFVVGDTELAAATVSTGERHDSLGAPLTIGIPPGIEKGEELVVRIDYETSPQASA